MVVSPKLENIFLLVFLIIILIFMLVGPKIISCQKKKSNKKKYNKNKQKFKQQLEHFVSQLEEGKGDSKVAIVTMVNKQPNFESWLDHHLNNLKIDLVILRVEDTPEYKPLVKPFGDRVDASFYTKEEINLKHNYFGQMERQEIFVNEAIEKAKQRNIDYIFHIDSDELIYVHPDNQKTSRDILLRKYLEEVHPDYSCIHFKNFEAVFPNMEEKCFNTNRFIDCKKGQCLSYANGKSVGRVKKGIKFRGCHYFTGKVFDITDDKLAVLHFDSCTYSKWKDKFNLLKDTNEDKLKKIPFPFYQNSIKKMQKCDSENKNEKECNEDLEKYYQEQKINPYQTKNTRELIR